MTAIRVSAFAVLAGLALVAAGPAAGQTAGQASARTADQQDPVEITADHFVINEAQREATFTGNVVVVHPSVTVWAPKVVVLYSEAGTSDIQSFEATGDVRLETPEQEATGDRAVFDPRARTLNLLGNVVVVNATGTVSGSELQVDLDTNVSTFIGGDGRVRAVFIAE